MRNITILKVNGYNLGGTINLSYLQKDVIKPKVNKNANKS